MPRPLRRRSREVADQLSPLDRMRLTIGPAPSLFMNRAEMARLAGVYRRHRSQIFAATEGVPASFWLFDDVPNGIRARHNAGDEPTRADVLDAIANER